MYNRGILHRLLMALFFTSPKVYFLFYLLISLMEYLDLVWKRSCIELPSRDVLQVYRARNKVATGDSVRNSLAANRQWIPFRAVHFRISHRNGRKLDSNGRIGEDREKPRTASKAIYYHNQMNMDTHRTLLVTNGEFGIMSIDTIWLSEFK